MNEIPHLPSSLSWGRVKQYLAGAAMVVGLLVWVALDLASCVQESVFSEQQVTVERAPAGLKVYPLWLKTNAGARDTEFYVKITNESSRTLEATMLVVRLFDKGGNFVGGETGYCERLAPGKSCTVQGTIYRSGDLSTAQSEFVTARWR